VEALLGSTDGVGVFESLRRFIDERVGAGQPQSRLAGAR
jgi:hypothetical protein